jgi:hypothetical protein
VLDAMWDSWKEMVIIGGRPLATSWQPGWKLPAKFAMEAQPLMVRAGMLGGMKA